MHPETRRRLVIVIFIFILVSTAAIGIYTLMGRGWGGSFITIEVAPTGADLKLDGRGTRAGKHQVRSGTHKISASKIGFAIQTKYVEVRDGESRYLGIVLIPNTKETEEWYKRNESDGRLAEQINGGISDQVSSDINAKYPLIKELPFMDLEFRIDYGVSKQHKDDPTAIAFYIRHYTELAKKEALNWMKSKGYNPEKLEIIYINTSGGN